MAEGKLQELGGEAGFELRAELGILRLRTYVTSGKFHNHCSEPVSSIPQGSSAVPPGLLGRFSGSCVWKCFVGCKLLPSTREWKSVPFHTILSPSQLRGLPVGVTAPGSMAAGGSLRICGGEGG